MTSASDRYVFLRQLGKGGMGEVWLAEDSVLKRQVAIKRIHPHLLSDKEFLERLSREAILHARVGNHPHIVSIHDRIDAPGETLVVMEFVPGLSLRSMLDDSSLHPGLEGSLRVGGQVLSALEVIHSHGIIHRDLKPENIIVEQRRDGLFARLLDFGIARGGGEHTLTMPMAGSPGTPLYMAPEQIVPDQFGGTTHAIDIYAMGVMLYECLAGRTPYGGGFNEVLAAHLYQSPRPITTCEGQPVPPTVSAVVLRALAKQPADRFPSAADFREALLAATRAEGARPAAAIAPPPTVAPSDNHPSLGVTAAGPFAPIPRLDPQGHPATSSPFFPGLDPDARIPGLQDDRSHAEEDDPFSPEGAGDVGRTVPRPGRTATPPPAAPKSGTRARTSRGNAPPATATMRAVPRALPRASDLAPRRFRWLEKAVALVGLVALAAGGFLAWSRREALFPRKLVLPAPPVLNVEPLRMRAELALREAAPFLVDFVPSVVARPGQPSVERNDGTKAELLATVEFSMNGDRALAVLAYLSVQGHLSEDHREALRWLTAGGPLAFRFRYHRRDDTWLDDTFELANAEDRARRTDFDRLLAENDARGIEHRMPLETLLRFRDILADKALATYLAPYAELTAKLEASRGKLASYQNAAAQASAQVDSLEQQARTIASADSRRENARSILEGLRTEAATARREAREYERLAVVEESIIDRLEKRRLLVLGALGSYAVGHRMEPLAPQCVALLSAYPHGGDQSGDLARMVIQRDQVLRNAAP